MMHGQKNLKKSKCNKQMYGFSFPSWLISANATPQSDFIKLSKVIRIAIIYIVPIHRLLNLLEARLTTQRWRSDGPAFVGQAGKKITLYIRC